jgi:hypothetical protein
MVPSDDRAGYLFVVAEDDDVRLAVGTSPTIASSRRVG